MDAGSPQDREEISCSAVYEDCGEPFECVDTWKKIIIFFFFYKWVAIVLHFIKHPLLQKNIWDNMIHDHTLQLNAQWLFCHEVCRALKCSVKLKAFLPNISIYLHFTGFSRSLTQQQLERLTKTEQLVILLPICRFLVQGQFKTDQANWLNETHVKQIYSNRSACLRLN